jgi:uncharacterized protein (TIRG00374 family)
MLMEAAVTIALNLVLIGILYSYIRYFTEPDVSYPSMLQLFLIFFVLNSVVYFSPTPGSTGVLELSYVYFITHLMSSSGSSSAIAAGVTAWRLATFYAPTLVGFVTTFFYIKKPSKDKKKENDNKVLNNKKIDDGANPEKVGESVN